VGQQGDTSPLARYFALPDADDDLERLGLNRFQPPVRASDLPGPLAETRAWGDHLLPAGFCDGFTVGLFSRDGRHLGFICLLTDDPAERTTAYCGLVARLRPFLARVLDRLPSMAAVADLAGDALGGAVLTRAGRCLPVPGLTGHPLLTAESAVVAVAREQVGSAGAHSSFLSPSPDGLLRITALDCQDGQADHLSTIVLVRHADDLEGLTMRDLQFLGALLAGWEAERVGARCGIEDVGAHADALAQRLGLSSRDQLLLHAAREGRYLPPALWP
jgi:hypothetical protein